MRRRLGGTYRFLRRYASLSVDALADKTFGDILMITVVDSLEIEILVDNTTDMLSSTPAGVESESARLFR